MVVAESDLIREFFALCGDGQSGLWGACTRSGMERAVYQWFPTIGSLTTAIAKRPAVLDYFVPTPFARKRKDFEALVGVTNIIRADIDPPSLATQERRAFVAEGVGRIRAVLGEPSAVVDSGRGGWVYYKLAQPVAKSVARDLNQQLQILSGSKDRSSFNPSQWVRCPGSVNEKTGEVARVLSVDPLAGYDPDVVIEALRSVVGEINREGERDSRDRGAGKVSKGFPWDEDELGAVELPRVELHGELVSYIGLKPSKEGCQATFGRSRSQVEQSIFNELVGQGWSDQLIHAFGYQNGLPRFMREFRRGSIWADLSLEKARDWVDSEEASRSEAPPNDESYREMSPPPFDEEEETSSRPDGRHPYPRWVVLKEIDGSKPGEVYERAAERLKGCQGTDGRSLQRHVARLVRDGDVIRVPGDDGIDRLVRTEKGEAAAAKRILPVRFLSYVPSTDGLRKREESRQREKENARAARQG